MFGAQTSLRNVLSGQLKPPCSVTWTTKRATCFFFPTPTSSQPKLFFIMHPKQHIQNCILTILFLCLISFNKFPQTFGYNPNSLKLLSIQSVSSYFSGLSYLKYQLSWNILYFSFKDFIQISYYLVNSLIRSLTLISSLIPKRQRWILTANTPTNPCTSAL